jgi:hypothetical protein
MEHQGFQALKYVAETSLKVNDRLKGQELETEHRVKGCELSAFQRWFSLPERFLEALSYSIHQV